MGYNFTFKPIITQKLQELAYTIRDCNIDQRIKKSSGVSGANILDSMSNTFRIHLWATLLDILFPQCCLGCGVSLSGRQALTFCQVCMEDVVYLEPPFCICCGKPFVLAAGESHYCGRCLTRPPHYERARAAVKYQAQVANAVRKFKYGGQTSGLSTFANLMHRYLQSHPLPKVDVIFPVPLHKKRLRQRGFNQALLLAREFFPQDHKKINPFVLFRSTRTQPQTGLNRKDRKKNVKNSFTVRQPDNIKGKRILLVDDVYTTGATVNECARILNRHGAETVNILTLARAVN